MVHHGVGDAGNACSTWLWRTGLRTWLLRVDIWHHSHARCKRRFFQTHAPNFLGTPCIPVISSVSEVPCLAFGTAVFGPIKITHHINEVSQEFCRREHVLRYLLSPGRGGTYPRRSKMVAPVNVRAYRTLTN
jgi:hypothetical protein